jgi:hypothetical protein
VTDDGAIRYVGARGGASTKSTHVEGAFELLVRVPWTKSRTQARRR